MVQLIEIGSPAFNEVIRIAAIEGAKAALSFKEVSEWMPEQEVVDLLQVSPVVLRRLRSKKQITFSKPSNKIILYQRKSVNHFLNTYKINAK
jgi:hypothetical protein